MSGFMNDAQKISATLNNITRTSLGALDTSDEKRIFVSPAIGVIPNATIAIDDIVLVTETGLAKHGDNYRSFQVVDITNTKNLLATAKTTRDVTAGIAITADVPYRITPDQNNTISTNTVLELQMTKTASPSALSECSVEVYWHWSV